MTTTAPAKRWRLRRSDAGFRLSEVRAFGTGQFTWADLLRAPLSSADVYVLYFPSRFDLPVDAAATESLRLFGGSTSLRTTVDFWDPRDEHFSEALGLFGLQMPPVLVLATGLKNRDGASADLVTNSLYSISFTDQAVLADRQQTAAAVNAAHEILVRCDPAEIAGYLRARKAKSVLSAIERLSSALRDQLIKLNPSFGLPGGLSLGIG